MKLVGIKRHMYVCMYGQRSITYAIHPNNDNGQPDHCRNEQFQKSRTVGSLLHITKKKSS